MLEPAEVGSTANSYEIIAKLATGGMAEIFLARTQSAAGVERYVVLKRVLRHRATDIKFVNMFLDEAKLAAQLQHPNIAQVYDTGKLGDSYFFTMEYVHGETVREVLHRAYELGQSVPIGCALTIIAGAAAGLQHAHERLGLDGKPLGIVHRDVSPSNLMITYEGNVKVVDFGVAKATHRSSETQSGSVKGKIGYMAPEQCRGGSVDQRCDLFSLGIVLWELLVGERLFKRATDYESMEAIVVEESPPPSTRRSDIPIELDRITMRLLAKSPDERFQSAAELLDELDDAAVRMGVSMSQPALRRFARELFGDRPEPWVEMRSQESGAAPEVVTVTGTPLLAAAILAELDDRLDRIFDLSSGPIRTHTPVPGLPPVVASTPKPTETLVTVSDVNMRAAVRHAKAAPEQEQEDDEAPPRPRRRWLAPAVLVAGLGAAAIVAVTVMSSPTSSANERAGAVARVDIDATPEVVVPVIADAAPPPPVVDAVQPAPVDAGRAPVDIATSYAAKRFEEVVGACAGESHLTAADASMCTLAACRVHAIDNARQWSHLLAASARRTATSTCAKLGITLEVRARVTTIRPRPDPKKNPPKDPPRDPPKKDPPKSTCTDADPMACRN